MKRLLLLKSLFLLCALVVGSSAWADTSTVTASKIASSSASWTGSASETWSVTVDGGATNQNVTNSYAQVGTKSSPSTSITFSTSGISGTITKIVVDCASYSGLGTISATVGGSAFGTQSQSIPSWSSNTGGDKTFSGSASGAIVITMTNGSGGRAMYIKSITVTYSAQQKSANELAWSAASKAVTYSEEPYGLPTLTNPHSLAITYDSSNKSVATIDSEGNVTIKNKTGNTTISATTTGDETYAAGTVSYTLNVTQKVIIEDGVFNFGFGPSNGGDYDSGMTQVGSGTIIENESETWTAGNVTLVVANRYAWNTDGKFVIYKKAGGANAAGSITLSCPDGKAITQIEFTGPYTGTGALSNMAANIGTYTVTSTSAIWTGAAQSVSFSASNSTYINTITVTYGSTISITPAKEYTTLTSALNLDFTSVNSDLKAYIATEISKGKVQMTQVNKVPAGTGLVLKATTPGSAVNVPVFDGTSPDDVSGNKMAGSATATTAVAENGGYILSDGVFQPATAGTLAAGKAYLNIAVGSSSARALEMNFDDNETTGLSEVTNTNLKNNTNEFFNLAGQRVAQPTKGLYIVNGKKVIIK